MIISAPVEIKRLIKAAHEDGRRRELGMAKLRRDAGWDLTPEDRRLLAKADIATNPAEGV